MQGKARREAGEAARERRDQGLVLVHVAHNYPTTFRLSDLVRELAEGCDFSQRDRIERAVAELVQVGLLFRCEAAVLPTRAALRVYEVLED